MGMNIHAKHANPANISDIKNGFFRPNRFSVTMIIIVAGISINPLKKKLKYRFPSKSFVFNDNP